MRAEWDREPEYMTIQDAAHRLSLTAEALEIRCRKCARKVGKEVQAHLFDGIVAFKFGRSWRVKFPKVAA